MHQCKLNKFADDTKLGVAVYSLEGCGLAEGSRYLGELESYQSLSMRASSVSCQEGGQAALGCIKQHHSQPKEEIPLLCLVPMWWHLECRVQFGSPQYKNIVKILESIQRRVTKLVKGHIP